MIEMICDVKPDLDSRICNSNELGSESQSMQ